MRTNPDDSEAGDGAGRADLVVLQVLPRLETGGVERGTVEMAEAIVRAGGRALVASEGGRLVAAVERTGGRHVALPLASKQPLEIWRNAARLAALIRAEGVRLVHARSRAPAWSAFLAARRTGVPFVTTYHGVYGEGAPGKRLYNSVMARGERVIAISRHVAAQVRARHGVPDSRLVVIPRGVDSALFDPDAVTPDRAAALARQWGLPEGHPRLVLPARLTRWKGGAVLVAALAAMRHRNAVAVLVGADQGRGGFAAELRRQAETLGLAGRVILAGHCDDMPAALALADVVVTPSVEPEPFGRTVIEAQAMARPVVVAGHGGMAETVEDGVTGWRVPPGDAAALAAALDRVLDMAPGERAALGARARAAARATYTTARMQAATLTVYREVLEERAAGPGQARPPRGGATG